MKYIVYNTLDSFNDEYPYGFLYQHLNIINYKHNSNDKNNTTEFVLMKCVS